MLVTSVVVGLIVVTAVNRANASRRAPSLTLSEGRACNDLLARVGDAQHRNELLFGVARAGDASAVSTLLDCGLDANARGASDRTVLEVAAYQGHESVVSELLARGADPNAGDRLGLTPLMNAAFRGEERIVVDLLAHGAVVDATNRVGQTR